jgi:hypothetical protein
MLRPQRACLPVLGGFLVAACGTSDPERISSAVDPILGGTLAQFARPEVGRTHLLHDCSMTMISSRHFLTAAHCLDFLPQLRGGYVLVDSPVRFAVVDVDRTLSQGRSLGDEDLAVGRLVDAIPPAVFTPASISTSQPSSTWLTAMGYGCIDRDTLAERDSKHYREYFFSGGDSNYQCEEDSGGPVFVGRLADNGPIARVHSGVHPGLFSDNDIGADAVSYRTHILALQSAMETDGICYRAHVQDHSWMPAVCNNTMAGTTGQSLRMEAIQIWSARPGVILCYRAHVAGVGWQSEVCDGEMAGTTGQSRAIEALTIRVASAPTPTSVFYQGHVQGLGWQGEVSNGAVVGTTGQSRRLEALTIRVTP